MGEEWEARVPKLWDDSALVGDSSETYEQHETAGANETIIDERVLCPTTGEVCDARLSIIKAYEQSEQHIPDSACFPADLQPRLDGIKLHARLAEYTARAGKIACQGITEDGCPVRISMNESPARNRTVGFLRTLLRKNT